MSRRATRTGLLRRWLELHKPRLGQSGQLFLAEMLWTVVGTALLATGLLWVLQQYGGFGLTYVLVFVAIGLAKALVILDRVARRAVERIAARGRDSCAGGFFSLKSWALVAVMILLGQTLRHSPLSQALLGLAYVAVGTALLFSSRTMWRRWWNLRGERTAPGG